MEENLQGLRAGSSRILKSASSEFAGLEEDLNSFGSTLPPRLKGQFEKSIKRLGSVEKKLLSLEGYFGENFEKIKESYLIFKSKSEEAQEEKRTLQILYELSGSIISEKDINVLLDMVVDALVDLIGAERSFLLISDESKSVKLRIGKDQNKEAIGEENLNQSIIEAVLETGEPISVSNLLISEDEEKEEPAKSVSILCVPLNSKDRTNGVFYLENSGVESYFTLEDVKFCLSLAQMLISSLEDNLLFWELKESQEKLLKDLREKFEFDEILGNSPQMVEILKTVADVADTDAAVLIEGESGTGKELLARAIHFNSSRRGKPFVPINCAAIPETLLESELFGYEKGAFTGADQRKLGKFDVANGGTIFLDEIGEMSVLLQVKILRFLQSHEFEPLGSNRIRESDIRIITATNKDLLARVKENRFREDLYYRINVINIKLPPLKERRLDIEPLAGFFVSKFSKREGKKIKAIDREVINALHRYGFPGNVRELENIMERAVILAKGDTIMPEDLPKTVLESSSYEMIIKTPQNYAELKAKKRKMIEELEKDFVKHILSKHNHNIPQAAREAKMHRVELHRLVKKYKE
ncbi:MAG: sigma 54-interacting transcriptional regulator [candidate division Zixibacteria bacterium]|nr:sigma 54-interacting transcriptional regulator [candidate division Zixibacteria bacterium]